MHKPKTAINFTFAILLLCYSTITNADVKPEIIEATKTNITTKENSNKISINDMSPNAIAKDVTENLILQFYKNSTKFHNNEKLMFDQIEEILYEVIAFKEVTRAVMGKYANQANEKQINKFTAILKKSLIQFYSKIFLEFHAEKFIIQKIDDVPQTTIEDYTKGKRRLIPVELTITKGSEKYQLKYSMIKSDNIWKLKNIIFNGINIGIQLKNQFYDFYNKSHNIDATIELWSSKMTN